MIKLVSVNRHPEEVIKIPEENFKWFFEFRIILVLEVVIMENIFQMKMSALSSLLFWTNLTQT